MNLHDFIQEIDLDAVRDDATYLIQTYGEEAARDIQEMIDDDDEESMDIGAHIVGLAFAAVVACKTVCARDATITPNHFYSVFQTVAQMFEVGLTRAERRMN